jgi:hypothetical protein
LEAASGARPRAWKLHADFAKPTGSFQNEHVSVTAFTRHIASIVAVVSLIVGQAFVCAPAFASEVTNHCRQDAARAAAAHDCCPSATMNCCAVAEQESPALPQVDPGQSRSGSTRLQPCGAPAVILVSTDRPALAEILRLAPPHGFRPTDLPVLNSAFLL